MNAQTFFDKRDQNYLKLNSPYFFFEMCCKKNIKLELLTPQTIIFEKGQPKLWLFNSKKTKTTQILKKNQDKNNLLEVAKQLTQFNFPADSRIDNIQTFYETIKQTKAFLNPQPVAFLRFATQKKSLNCQELVKLFLEAKELGSFISIQGFIINHSKANEIYYTEYRKDNDNLPVNYKFFKKTLTKKIQRLKAPVQEETNPFQSLIKSTTNLSNSNIKQDQLIQVFFKSFDGPLNQRFQDRTQIVVQYIELAFRIKVKKIVCKFIIDSLDEIQYVGIYELFISIPKEAPYNLIRFQEEMAQSSNRWFEMFMQVCKALKISQQVKPTSFPKNIVQNSKSMSQLLFKNLILEKCQGDFCDYMMMERNKGPLQLKKSIQEKYRSAFQTNSTTDTLEKISTNLPHEISQQLILRTRECADDVVKLFQKNKIQLKISGYQDDNQSQDLDQEFPFRRLKKEVYNLEILYRKVKICKTCFILYSMIAKEFDNTLRKDLQIKSWVSLPVLTAIKEITTTSLNSENQLYKMKSIQESKMDDDEVLSEKAAELSQKPFSSTQHVAITRSQTEQRFRVKGRNFEKQPIKIYVVPKNLHEGKRQALTSQADRTGGAQQQMEVNRLTLGYMNYQQLDSYKKNIQDLPDTLREKHTKRHAYLEEMNLNLIAHLAQEKSQPTRKLDSIASENIHLLKLSEDLKNFKKRILNDSDLRQSHQQYFLSKVGEEGQLDHILTTSYFYYHANFLHLRRVHKFRLITPLQPITDDLKYDKLKPLSLEYVCQLMTYPLPTIKIPQLRYHVYDEKTAIPFVLLSSEQTLPKVRQKNNSRQSGIEIIIFLQDLFESFYEYYDIILENLNNSYNKKILIMNLPGQSYTIFSLTTPYNSLIYSQMLDQILLILEEEKEVDLFRDTLKLVGIGSGGLVLQTFMCEAYGHIPQLTNITLINSFSGIDDQLFNLLCQTKKIITGHPKTMPELSYEYMSTLVNTKPLGMKDIEKLMKINPILVNGRLTMINGIINSPPLVDRFQRILVSVQVYHSLKNCLVNIQEADLLSQFIQDDVGEINNSILTKKLSQTKRTVEYFDGGHNVLHENPTYLNTIFERIMA